jgi:peptidoglycan-associated lipoprotein
MRTNTRTLSAAVFTAVLLLGAAGCGGKKPPVVATPKPVETKPEPTKPEPTLAARIVNFTVQPNSIDRGQAATLAWSVANSTDISINQGIGAVQANGTRQVFPTNTTSYTLTARGAGGNDTRTATVTVTAPTPITPPAPKTGPRISGGEMFSREQTAGNLADALFDYDKSDIRADAQQALTRSAATLRQIFAQDPTFKVVMEGHCDERGSAEYNLGLGDRRATSARDFLVQLGVPANNITTISYGKERPVCTDADEACYQRNRRAHLAAAQ